jgi:hypothetical protein
MSGFFWGLKFGEADDMGSSICGIVDYNTL